MQKFSLGLAPEESEQLLGFHGFTSGGQESGSAAVYKIQASKRYVGSLPLVLKDKKNLLLTR